LPNLVSGGEVRKFPPFTASWTAGGKPIQQHEAGAGAKTKFLPLSVAGIGKWLNWSRAED
jgi:hypothetical protein